MPVHATLTSDQAIARAKALVPVLAERAARTEALCRLPDDTFADLVASGLFRITQPRRFGGAELPLTDAFQVVRQVSRGCGSAGWTYAVMTSHGWLLSHFPDQAQQDVWGAHPDAVLSTSFSGGPPPTATGDGYHIGEGRWRFSTGIHHADWVILRAEVSPDGAAPDPVFMLIPKDEVEIIEDWRAVGLAGTGSCSILIRDAHVPRHRTVRLKDITDGTSPGREVNGGLLYKLPFTGSWQVFMTTTATGIARAALDAWIARTRLRLHRTPRASAASGMADPIRLGGAAARIEAAEALIVAAATRVTAEVTATGTAGPDTQARGRRDYVFSVRLCVEAVEDLFLAAGASTLDESSPIQRCWRDIHAVAQHAANNLDEGLCAWGERMLLGAGGVLSFG